MEKAELSAKEQSSREHLQMIQKEKERLEIESEQKLQQLRKESKRTADEL